MDIVNAILSSIMFIVAGYVAIFYKKKGENLATKQDIAEITQKIETVKARLQVSTKSEIDFRTYQKEAVLTFYDDFVYWYEVLLHMQNTNLDITRFNEIPAYRQSIETAAKKVLISSRRLELYTAEDSELFNLSVSLIRAGIRTEGYVIQFLYRIEESYEEINEYIAKWKEGININEDFLRNEQEKVKEEWKNINQNNSEMDKQVDPLLIQYRQLAMKYLKGE